MTLTATQRRHLRSLVRKGSAQEVSSATVQWMERVLGIEFQHERPRDENWAYPLWDSQNDEARRRAKVLLSGGEPDWPTEEVWK